MREQLSPDQPGRGRVGAHEVDPNGVRVGGVEGQVGPDRQHAGVGSTRCIGTASTTSWSARHGSSFARAGGPIMAGRMPDWTRNNPSSPLVTLPNGHVSPLSGRSAGSSGASREWGVGLGFRQSVGLWVASGRVVRRTSTARWAIGSVVERLVHTEEVTGSNPVSPTRLAQPIPRTGALDRRSRRSQSRRSRSEAVSWPPDTPLPGVKCHRVTRSE